MLDLGTLDCELGDLERVQEVYQSGRTITAKFWLQLWCHANTFIVT
jgi:hypothetical protein